MNIAQIRNPTCPAGVRHDQSQESELLLNDSLNERDVERIDHMVELLKTSNDVDVVAKVVPRFAKDLTALCRLDHVALLVCPPSNADLVSDLERRGFTCAEMVPSVVVRERIRTRYALSAPPDVSIQHATVELDNGALRELEVFVLLGVSADVAAREQREESENHIAVSPRVVDEAVVGQMMNLLLDSGLASDGGGFNSHENLTVLYFRRPDPATGIHRLELVFPGQFPQILDDHLSGSHSVS